MAAGLVDTSSPRDHVTTILKTNSPVMLKYLHPKICSNIYTQAHKLNKSEKDRE